MNELAQASRYAPDPAERLLAALAEAPDGLARSRIGQLLHGLHSAEIADLLDRLLSEGRVRGQITKRQGKGRPMERWFLANDTSTE